MPCSFLGAVTGVFAIIGAAIGLGAVGLEIGNNLLPDDREMYVNALKSLGMKVRIPKAEGDKPKPTIGEMVSKLMG